MAEVNMRRRILALGESSAAQESMEFKKKESGVRAVESGSDRTGI